MDLSLRLGPLIVDVARRRDLSAPIRFGAVDSRAFSLPAAHSHPVEGGGFVGLLRGGWAGGCAHRLDDSGEQAARCGFGQGCRVTC